MKVESKKSFNKDISKIRDRKLLQRIKTVIQQIESASSILQVHNLKKLSGSDNAYRIRIGEYRMGFYLVNNIVELTVFDNRKDIYKNFPLQIKFPRP